LPDWQSAEGGLGMRAAPPSCFVPPRAFGKGFLLLFFGKLSKIEIEVKR